MHFFSLVYPLLCKVILDFIEVLCYNLYRR
nr:MAG TPA: hypothetical protein [Caudoviricetes sp.]